MDRPGPNETTHPGTGGTGTGTVASGWVCPDDDPRFDLVGAAIDGKLDAVRQITGECIPDAEQSVFDDMALRRAAQFGHVEIVRFLLTFGADPEATDNDGDNALQWAARWIQATDHAATPDPDLDARKAAVVAILVDIGVEVDGLGSEGRTPLIVATIGGWADVVEVLVEAGARVDVASDHDEWPLIIAAGLGRIDIVATLLAAGADVGVEDVLGRTALEVARDEGHEDVVAQLQ